MDLFQVESNSIDLLLLDHRETVVDGSRKPSFCGYMRTSAGIAYQVHTVTKKSFLEEIGDWSMDGNILTMVYPENVVLTFVQEVVFTNDNIVQFIEVSGSEYEAWEGTYYRAD
mgnify:CR=1 FL=1